MRRVYLIRHGLPDFPDGKRMCLGRTDLPLGPEGFLQAEKAAEALRGVPLSAIFSSPLIRAVQTAQALGRPITLLEDLREMDAGEWDGLTFEEIRVRYPKLYAARGTDKSLPLPGGESNEHGLNRFRRAMLQAAGLCSGDFAVVAHGGIMGLFLRSLGSVIQKPRYAEIIALNYENGHFTLSGGKNL